MSENREGDSEMFREFSVDEDALARVRRVGALGPDTAHAKEMIDQLANAFGKAGVEVDSVAAVPIDKKSILMIDVGDAKLVEVIQFLSEMLASGLDQPVVALIGNRAFTHRLNVALDAAGHGTDLLLPDEIVWIVPESLQDTLRELDESFSSSASSEQASGDGSGPVEPDESQPGGPAGK